MLLVLEMVPPCPVGTLLQACWVAGTAQLRQCDVAPQLLCILQWGNTCPLSCELESSDTGGDYMPIASHCCTIHGLQQRTAHDESLPSASRLPW